MKIFSTLAKNPWELDIEHPPQGAIPHENQSLFQIFPQMIVAPTHSPPPPPPPHPRLQLGNKTPLSYHMNKEKLTPNFDHFVNLFIFTKSLENGCKILTTWESWLFTNFPIRIHRSNCIYIKLPKVLHRSGLKPLAFS